MKTFAQYLTENRSERNLHEAIDSGNLTLIKKLVKDGADVNGQYDGYSTASFLNKDAVRTLNLLIKLGLNIDIKNQADGRSALHCAMQIHNKDNDENAKCVEILINKGADIHAVDNDKETPLHNLPILNGTEYAIVLLIRAGLNPYFPAVNSAYNQAIARYNRGKHQKYAADLMLYIKTMEKEAEKMGFKKP